MACKGKKAGFQKVIKLIDDLTAKLKKEQVDDESKKAYCEAQFDQADDKKKATEGQMSDLEKAIDSRRRAGHRHFEGGDRRSR